MPSLGVWKLDFGPVLALDSAALSAVGAYTLVRRLRAYGCCQAAQAASRR